MDPPLFPVGEVQIKDISDEKVTFVGYPSNDGNGTKLNFIDNIAISSKCENKEAAWEFVIKEITKIENSKSDNFANGRDVRNLFEKAVSRQSDRVAQMEAPTKEDLMELRTEDLQEEADAEEIKENLVKIYEELEFFSFLKENPYSSP